MKCNLYINIRIHFAQYLPQALARASHNINNIKILYSNNNNEKLLKEFYIIKMQPTASISTIIPHSSSSIEASSIDDTCNLQRAEYLTWARKVGHTGSVKSRAHMHTCGYIIRKAISPARRRPQRSNQVKCIFRTRREATFAHARIVRWHRRAKQLFLVQFVARTVP